MTWPLSNMQYLKTLFIYKIPTTTTIGFLGLALLKIIHIKSLSHSWAHAILLSLFYPSLYLFCHTLASTGSQLASPIQSHITKWWIPSHHEHIGSNLVSIPIALGPYWLMLSYLHFPVDSSLTTNRIAKSGMSYHMTKEIFCFPRTYLRSGLDKLI